MYYRRSVRQSLWFLCLFLLLVGCNTLTPQQDLGEVLEPIPLLGSLETQATVLTPWQAEDGNKVEVLGVGMGNRFAAENSATIDIADPGSVVKLYAQVVLREGTGNITYLAPNDVTVSTSAQSKSFSGGELAASLPSAPDDTPLSNIGRIYEGEFVGGVSSITATIDGIGNTNSLTPRAFIVYVFRDAAPGETTSAGTTPNIFLFGQLDYITDTQTISLPDSFSGGTVTVTHAVEDLQNDTRLVKLSAEAGGLMVEETFTTPSEGDELLIATLTLNNVPSTATEVVVTATSPKAENGQPLSEAGDSVFWNGINVSFETTPPPPGGIEGCTPGYWRQPQHLDSWTDYLPDDLFSGVFGQILTIKTGLGGGKPSQVTDPTLLEAVWATGGGDAALARHAVAALLNASSAGVAYPYTVADVVALVESTLSGGDVEATKDTLASANELGCPLN